MTLFALALLVVIALAVLWNVALTYDYQMLKKLLARAPEEGGPGAFHFTFIALGSFLFVLTIVLLSVLGAQLFWHIRFSQRLSTSMAAFTHELKSPLASIKMFAQTLVRPGLKEEERQQFLRLILVDVERLSRQITNVLDAAQLDSLQGLQIAPEWTDLRAFLEDYLQARQPYLRLIAGNARLELVPGPQVAVKVDPHVFGSVLDNLVDNAVKYAREGGVRIRLVIRPADRPDRVWLEVADDGTGIAPKDLPRLFQRFSRVDPGQLSPRQRGTGLGLWIVDTIVSAHGGKVSARSDGPGHGTTIRIELPCSSLQAGAERDEAKDGSDPSLAPAGEGSSAPSESRSG